MAAPTAGPCAPWITGSDIPTAACADPDKRALAASAASVILYRLSGRQYPGICERTIRPCGVGCGSWARWPAYRDHWWPATQTPSGTWSIPGGIPVLMGGQCDGRCRLPSVTLPGPIVDVIEVVVDGVVLDPGAYQVVGWRRLERLDGETWPCTQSMAANSGPGGDPGTMQVTYRYGRLPDDAGMAAVIDYASEYAKLLCGNVEGCRLPRRTRSVVRQGISFEVTSNLDYLDKGRTGVETVDNWLVTVNPARLVRRSTVTRLG